MLKKSFKKQLHIIGTLFAGVTFAYLMWLLWKKLTDYIGDSWIIVGILVVVLILLSLGGYFSFNRIADKYN